MQQQAPQPPPGAEPVNHTSAPGGFHYQRPQPIQALVATGWYSRSDQDRDIHYSKPEALARLDRGDSAAGSDLWKVIAECGAAFHPLPLQHGDYVHHSFPSGRVCRECLKAAES